MGWLAREATCVFAVKRSLVGKDGDHGSPLPGGGGRPASAGREWVTAVPQTPDPTLPRLRGKVGRGRGAAATLHPGLPSAVRPSPFRGGYTTRLVGRGETSLAITITRHAPTRKTSAPPHPSP